MAACFAVQMTKSLLPRPPPGRYSQEPGHQTAVNFVRLLMTTLTSSLSFIVYDYGD